MSGQAIETSTATEPPRLTLVPPPLRQRREAEVVDEIKLLLAAAGAKGMPLADLCRVMGRRLVSPERLDVALHDLRADPEVREVRCHVGGSGARQQRTVLRLAPR
jgi:hypothetical protein